MTTMTTPETTPAPWDSKLADRVSSYQDAGREIYVWGWTPDGRYALVIDNDHDTASVCHRDTATGLGRWETYASRLDTAAYWPRFPNR
jgi:hypothetical protein